MTRTLALIPARGGSKGIPGKNLRPVGGKPLIVWTIEQALAIETAGVDVVVSTDDAAIATIARAAGAQVLDRPAELARDETPTEPVVLQALDALGGVYDRVLLLQATSPVRLPGTLDRALREHSERPVDSLVGVVPMGPFVWALGDGSPAASYDVDNRLRRQDMTAEDLRYRETGSVYVTDTAIYRTRHNRLGGRIGLFVMDEVEGLDIDTEADLEIAAARLGR